MIKVMVMSLRLVEHIRAFDDDTLVISITSPGRTEAEIKGKNIHRFQFNDVQEDLMLDSGIMSAMTDGVAEAIVKTVIDNKHLNKMIVHCEEGISRSPGIAIGLSRYFEMSPDFGELVERHPHHNKHVVKMIHKAVRKAITEELKATEEGG